MVGYANSKAVEWLNVWSGELFCNAKNRNNSELVAAAWTVRLSILYERSGRCDAASECPRLVLLLSKLWSSKIGLAGYGKFRHRGKAFGLVGAAEKLVC